MTPRQEQELSEAIAKGDTDRVADILDVYHRHQNDGDDT